MSAKDWVKECADRKSIVILELLRVTALFRKSIEVDDEEDAEKWMEKREALLSELGKIDEKLKGHATSRDQEFLMMLNRLKKMDEELLEIGTKGREMIMREVLHFSKMRVEILTQAMVEPKGNSLSVKV